MSHLLTLPQELLDQICDNLDRKSLKALRLTSKHWTKLSTPLVFSSFRLYPHIRSFERLSKIAQADNLRHHVRALEYDTSYIGLTDRLIRRIQSVWSQHISQDEKNRTLAHARDLDSQTIRVENDVDNLTQLNYLARTFAKFTCLKSLSVFESGMGINEFIASFDYGHLPHFYAQLVGETCGLHRHTRLEHGMRSPPRTNRATHAHAVLMAAQNLPGKLEELSLEGLTWTNLLNHGSFARFPVSSLSSLKRLRLSSSDFAYLTRTKWVANLQVMLKAATNLESLHLQFRAAEEVYLSGPNLMDDEVGCPCPSLFQKVSYDPEHVAVPAQLTWSPNLKELHLVGLSCTSKEFKSILRACVTSLLSLTIGHGTVIMPEVRGGPRACLVSLLKWMQRHLHLESFAIYGRVTNGGMQDWMIDPPVKYGEEEQKQEQEQICLYSRVKTFVEQGGPCPLDHVALKSGDFDLKKKEYKSELPEVLLGAEYSGDKSWAMEYDDEEEGLSEMEDIGEEDMESDWSDEDDNFPEILGGANADPYFWQPPEALGFAQFGQHDIW